MSASNDLAQWDGSGGGIFIEILSHLHLYKLKAATGTKVFFLTICVENGSFPGGCRAAIPKSGKDHTEPSAFRFQTYNTYKL